MPKLTDRPKKLPILVRLDPQIKAQLIDIAGDTAPAALARQIVTDWVTNNHQKTPAA
jgi:hypothetical protein